MKLHNRAAIITGASQGLGAEIAEHFAREGASLVLCARSMNKLAEVERTLMPHLKDGQRIVIQQADVAKESDIDALVATALDAFPHLDILVNNAGIYGPLGAIEDVDWEQWKEANIINLFGTIYACRVLLPHLKRRGYGKIINLSGGGATNPLPRISAYASSKAAVVRMTETLALEAKDDHIDINAIAPGALATKLNQDLVAAGPEIIGEAFHAKMQKMVESGGTPLDLGAKLCVWLASKESDGITGKLISAQWDPWENLQDYAEDLDGGDIYALRRIVPKERGKDWGDT